MPLLRSLTLKLKIKGKLSPPGSPTAGSPTSFEAVGRQEKQKQNINTSVESINSEDDCIDASPKTMLEALEKRPDEKKLDRVSRFREELAEGD